MLNEIKVGSKVKALVNMNHAFSKNIHIPKGTLGTVKDVALNAGEILWLHIQWEAVGTEESSFHACKPAAIELQED